MVFLQVLSRFFLSLIYCSCSANRCACACFSDRRKRNDRRLCWETPRCSDLQPASLIPASWNRSRRQMGINSLVRQMKPLACSPGVLRWERLRCQSRWRVQQQSEKGPVPSRLQADIIWPLLWRLNRALLLIRLVLEMCRLWSLVRKHHFHLETYYKRGFSGPHPKSPRLRKCRVWARPSVLL